MGAQKSVTIEFDDSGLEKAKGSHYRLCFAKKVGDHDYNVVWQSYDKYIHSNDFTWTPKYQIFGTNSFGGPSTCQSYDEETGDQSQRDDHPRRGRRVWSPRDQRPCHELYHSGQQLRRYPIRESTSFRQGIDGKEHTHTDLRGRRPYSQG